MGLKDLFKKKNDDNNNLDKGPCKIYAPGNGYYIPMKDIPDPVFSEGILGTCSGLDPQTKIVTSPANGKVIQLAETGHAVGIQTNCGIQILLHIGIDTVKMEGDGFKILVKKDQKVSRGDNLVEIDIDKIKKAGYSPMIMTIITNSEEYCDIKPFINEEITSNDIIFEVKK